MNLPELKVMWSEATITHMTVTEKTRVHIPSDLVPHLLLL